VNGVEDKIVEERLLLFYSIVDFLPVIPIPLPHTWMIINSACEDTLFL
jgi:hypothetical protein